MFYLKFSILISTKPEPPTIFSFIKEDSLLQYKIKGASSEKVKLILLVN
jgi:hypothetical protein